MKRTEIDLNKLVAITCQLFKNLGTDLSLIPQFTRNDQNIWVKICKEYYGKVCYKRALLIYVWFKRNTQNFSKIVYQKLISLVFYSKEDTNISNKDENEISIEFCLKEFKSFVVSNKKRRRLLCDFEEALNIQLKKNGFNCYFKCSYKWFKSDNSRKRNLPLWSGIYICIQKDCQQPITTKIAEMKNDKVIVQILFSDKKKHENIFKSRRIIGEERKKAALKLKADGVSNVCDSLNKKVTKFKKNTLQKIVNEFDHRFRLNRDLIFDLKATKTLCQNLGISTNAEFRGFVHNISLDPYVFLLMSDIQLKIWIQVKHFNPIWYFDATGSVHKEIVSQKKPLLYSIVFHDKKNKIIMPIAEFITTEQTTKSISIYLQLIYFNILDYNKSTENKIPPIIVTDFSWAIINSILTIFNKASIRNYLNWCYEEIFGFQKESKNFSIHISTRVYLCSTHFLKTIVRKVNKMNLEINVKNLFIFCFSMLQNAITIKQFNNYLLNIFNILNNSKKDETLLYSLETMRREIKNRNLNTLDFSNFSNDQTIEEKNNDSDNDFEIVYSETFESLKKVSPFSAYFTKMTCNLRKQCLENNSMSNLPLNPFFSPKLYDLIADQLYIMPLWCGIIPELYGKSKNNCLSECFKTRLTNNPVESYFGNLKKNILQSKKCFPSEFVSLNFMRIKAKYLDYYFQNSEKESKNLRGLMNKKEEWSDKNIKKKKQPFHYDSRPTIEKGFYFQNYDIFKYIYQNLFEYDPMFLEKESKEYIQTFHNVNLCIEEKCQEPMDISQEEIRFDFKIFKEFYYKITNEVWDFDAAKKFFESKEAQLINMVNNLRNIQQSAVYSGQNLDQSRYFSMIVELFNLNGFVPISTLGDGNCFYRSISTLLFGSDEFYYLIKIGSIYMLLEYRDLFSNIVTKHYYAESYEKIFCKSLIKNEWAMMLNILATSILLNREILIFNLSTETLLPYCYKYLIGENHCESLKIGFASNHFVPLISKNINNSLTIENYSDLFINFREKIKIY